MDWTQVLTIMIVMATNLTTVIILYCHQDSKLMKFIEVIQAEMRDFHGKLCAIEERSRK
jgi:hypothetical protein